ncbi:hypothetical protein [Streptomyces sp. NPDC046261]|uniref:hypothetical protein n=1 Tax=Streptomyces sp. NPDC046261 TaxID=3157200 RepID=UPI0033E82523
MVTYINWWTNNQPGEPIRLTNTEVSSQSMVLKSGETKQTSGVGLPWEDKGRWLFTTKQGNFELYESWNRIVYKLNGSGKQDLGAAGTVIDRQLVINADGSITINTQDWKLNWPVRS